MPRDAATFLQTCSVFAAVPPKEIDRVLIAGLMVGGDVPVEPFVAGVYPSRLLVANTWSRAPMPSMAPPPLR